MADLFTWTPDLSVHVQAIDDQHQELFRKFNQVGEAVWDGRGKEEIGKLIDFLADYVVTHFRDEEAIMQEHGYPGYQTQKKAHDDFVVEVNDMKSRLAAGDVTSDLIVSVVTKLGEWLRNHIKGLDRELGEYIVSKQ